MEDGLEMRLSHGVLGLWEARSCPCESFNAGWLRSRPSIFMETIEEVGITVGGIRTTLETREQTVCTVREGPSVTVEEAKEERALRSSTQTNPTDTPGREPRAMPSSSPLPPPPSGFCQFYDLSNRTGIKSSGL